MRSTRTTRLTALVVLIAFVGGLAAPIVEASSRAPVIRVKVPGQSLVFDLNTAGMVDLQRLPGIGPATAAEILKYRKAHGAFRSFDQLGQVKGVGPARLKVLRSTAVQGARTDLRVDKPVRPPAAKPAPRPSAPAPRKVTGRPTVARKALPPASAPKPAAKALPPASAPKPAAKALLPPSAPKPAPKALPVPRKPVLASKTAKPAAVPRAPVTVEPPKIVVRTGRQWVNLNNPNTRHVMSRLVEMGLSDHHASALLNARLTRGRYAPIQSYAELYGRMHLRGVDGSFIDTHGNYRAPPPPKTKPASRAPTVKVTQPAREVLVYPRGERLMARVTHDGRTVEVNLNQQGASQVYRQLRAAGIAEDVALQISKARIKGTFKSHADLVERAPMSKGVTRLPKGVSSASATSPGQPRGGRPKTKMVSADKPARVAVDPRLGTIDAEIARLGRQYDAIVARKPTSEQGFDRTLSSLKATQEALRKQVEAKAAARGGKVDLAKDPQLARIQERIRWTEKGKASLRGKHLLDQARARIDSEVSTYSRQGREAMGATPKLDTVAAHDRHLASLRQAYDGLFKSLEARARLEGKVVDPRQITKDPRLTKISQSIDATRASRSKVARSASTTARPKEPVSEAKTTATRKPRSSGARRVTKPGELVEARGKVDGEPVSRVRPSRRGSATAPTGEETVLRQKIAALQDKLIREGKFGSNQEAYKASQRGDARGDVKKLGNAIDELRRLRASKPGAGDSAPKPAQTASKPDADRPSGKKVADTATARRSGETAPGKKGETVARSRGGKGAGGRAPALTEPVAPTGPTEPAAPPAAPLTREDVVRQKIEFRMKKILGEGRFKSPEDVYKASQRSDARGDVKKLGNAVDELRQIRAGKTGPDHGAVPAAEPPGAAPRPAPGDVPKTTPVETEVASQPSGRRGQGPVQPNGRGAATRGGGAGAGLSEVGSVTAGEPTVPAETTGKAPPSQAQTAHEAAARSWAEKLFSFGKPSTALPQEPSAPVEPTRNWADEYMARMKGQDTPVEPASGTFADKLRRLFGAKPAPPPEQAASNPGFFDEMQATLKGKTSQAPSEPTLKGAGAGSAFEANLVRESELSLQSKELIGRLVKDGQFASTREAYLASEQPGATGELARLKDINQEIRTLRTQRHSAAADPAAAGLPAEPVAEATAPRPGASEPTLTEPVAKQGQQTASQPAAGGFGEKLGNLMSGKGWKTNSQITGGQPAAGTNVPPGEPVVPGEAAPGGKGPTLETIAETKPASEPVAQRAGGGFGEKLTNWMFGKGWKTNSQIFEAKAAASAGAPPESIAMAATEEGATVPRDAKVAQLEEVNADLKAARTKAHDLTAEVSKKTGMPIEEVQAAAKEPGATGKLAELKTASEKVSSLNAHKEALATEITNAPPKSPREVLGKGATTRGAGGTPLEGPLASETAPGPGKGGGAPSEPVSGGKGVGAPAEPVAGGKSGGAPVEPVPAGGTKPGAPVEPVPAGGAKPGAPVEPVPAGGAKPVGGPAAPSGGGGGTAGGAPVEPVPVPGAKPAAPGVGEVPAAPGTRPGVVTEPAVQSGQGTQGPTNPLATQPKPQALVGPATDALSALKLRQVEIANQVTALQGQTGGVKGLIRRFLLMQNPAGQVQKLEAELAKNQARITELESSPDALAKANAAWKSDTRIQKALGSQGRLIQAYEVELAKVDPNSRYGKVLQEKVGQLKAAPPESFAASAKNMFIVAAATNILMSLGRQIKSGESPDLGKAVGSIANPGFLVGTAGVAAGAFLGSRLAMMPALSLMLTRVGSFLPPVGQVFVSLLPAFLGGALGGAAGGMLFGQKPDWALILTQTLGSALGTALAITMFPGLGIVGQIAGGMLGAWVAEKILSMIRGHGPESEAATSGPVAGGGPALPPAEGGEAASVQGFSDTDLQQAFDGMTQAYQKYVQAEKDNKLEEATNAYQEYVNFKRRVDAMRQASARKVTAAR